MRTTILTLLLLTSTILHSTAKPLLPDQFNRDSHPPRIIRTCCMFGSKVGIAVLSFVKLTEVTSLDRMGSHHYLGKPSENNGIIYTKEGGFIDAGHMRDQADWTAYLYSLMRQERYRECIFLKLGYEGGNKRLSISVPPDLSDDDLLLLAGRMAYDLSLWHEIATWFGVRSVPLVSEQFSSFSVEDSYSNLLGVSLGMEAVKSDLSYDKAMTRLVSEKLNALKVVRNETETLQAMEMVRDLWWTRKARMPSTRVQIARLTSLYDTIVPMLIPDTGLIVHHPQPVIAPSVTSKGDSLTHFYDLSIKLNHKFPVGQLFPGITNKTITQKQFGILVTEIDRKLQTGFLSKSKTELASLRKTERMENRKTRGTDRNLKPEKNQNL